MTLGDGKLDVYRLSIDYVAWVDRLLEEQTVYGNGKNDFDPDSDFDLDKEQFQSG